MNDNGNAAEFQKLLGPLAAQTRALPGGGDNRNVHKDSDE
jgi:hypothetical protein